MGDIGRLIDWHNGRMPTAVGPSPPPAKYPPVVSTPRPITAQPTEASLDEVYECLLRK